MPLINWIDSYNINVSPVDTQHRGLADLINELHDAMLKGAGTSVIGEVVDRLVDYTVSHFDMEEELMRRYGYPGYDDHKREHEKLVQWVAPVQQAVRAGKRQVTVDVMKVLKEWFINHTQGIDRKMGPFLNDKGVC